MSKPSPQAMKAAEEIVVNRMSPVFVKPENIERVTARAERLSNELATIIDRHMAEREAALRAALDIYETIMHLQSTCVVCDCALHNPDSPPHCHKCLTDEEHEADWRTAMRDHHKMLDTARRAL